ncbi:hypothetical protein MUA02_05485 [Enterobacteriaceae bacterium H20N1]|uniref:Uncharacterized protein n=1 Tax=Dryocola boscaweniae TaxID=2925397 RepID=A0A9X2W6U0_9ENTR|nr:hypothetical protein [Dryocola boscaweniae]MCT4701262.1 hypothetical protein [Dryocola boscaweniae]MCT4718503.1 hypothetical protein [Dryocola boscaweniae]
MSYNSLIIKKLEADKQLAVILEKGFSETGQQVLRQAELILSGFTRLTWYSSCFFDNYLDVCSRLKEEDIRFARALAKLIGQWDVIWQMVELFINYLVRNLSDERIRSITRLLAQGGANFTASTVSNRSFAYSISSAVCISLGLRNSVNSALTKTINLGVALTGVYGYAQAAANAVSRLKNKNHTYYMALYAIELEMLYFLIEPTIRQVDLFGWVFKTDREIVSDILRITR